MTTGIESFVDPRLIGALHPGAGSGLAPGTGGAEWIACIVVLAVLVWWHLWQYWAEGKQIKEAVALYKEVGMERAMAVATGKVLTDEEIKALEVYKKMGIPAGH